MFKEPKEYSPGEKRFYSAVLTMAAYIFAFSGFFVNNEKIGNSFFGLSLVSSLLAIKLENEIKDSKIQPNIKQMFLEMPVPPELQEEQEIESFRQRLIQREENGELFIS